MGSGKIKDAWPVWTLVIVGALIIIVAMNQSKVEKEAVTIEDIFSSKTGSSVPSGDQASSVDPNDAKMDPVQSPAIVTDSDGGPQISYAVQLYSFKEQPRADAIVKTLKASNIPAYVQMSDLGDRGTWYRVRVGSYATADEAQAMLAEIRKEHKDSIVVKDRK